MFQSGGVVFQSGGVVFQSGVWCSNQGVWCSHQECIVHATIRGVWHVLDIRGTSIVDYVTQATHYTISLVTSMPGIATIPHSVTSCTVSLIWYHNCDIT